MLPRGLQVEKGTLTLTLSYNRFNGHLATTHYGVAVKLGHQGHLPMGEYTTHKSVATGL